MPELTPLDQTLLEIEAHVAASGWDRPAQLFALVRTRDLIRDEPELAATLGLSGATASDDLAAAADSFTPIEQEQLPDTPLDEALAHIEWAPTVGGCALVQEVVALPPKAEAALPDQDDPIAYAAAHPDRQEMRLAVAVLRDGRRSCAARIRPGSGSSASPEPSGGGTAHASTADGRADANVADARVGQSRESDVLVGQDLAPKLGDALLATLR